MADEPIWNQNFLNFDANSKCKFIDVSKDDVDKLIAQQENENTKRKTMFDLNIVLKHLHEVRKEDRELEEIPPEELSLFLSEFIIRQLEQRKVNIMSRLLSQRNLYKR